MTNDPNVEEEKQPPTSSIISDDESLESSEVEETTEDRENREDSRFKEGQILRFVRVRFPGNSRSFAFLVGKRTIDYGQKVVAMSDRGMAVGYVNSFHYDVEFNKSMLPVRSISKLANDEDIVNDKKAYHQQKNAENICNDLIEEHKLDMHLTHVEFTSFGKKAVFYFIAPARVDFRDLVRDLVGKLKTRIELRQISVRDRSAAIGGIGPCGRELCCSSFLTKYGNVGIKMAKNQDLTLNFSKLNGVCGQLKCCLQYEDDVYREKRSRLPREGDYITTHTGEIGRVDRLHLLSEQFVMMTNKGIRRRYVVEQYKDTLDKETANFPKEFDSVSDETHKVIGLDEAQTAKLKIFEQEVKTYKEASKSYADNIFESLFGEKSLGISLPEVAELDDGRAKKVFLPDEEEELSYTPSDEELLDQEDDAFEDGAVPAMTSPSPSRLDHRHPRDGRDIGVREPNANRGGRDNPHRGNSGNRDGRPEPRRDGQSHDRDRGPRDDNRNRQHNPNNSQNQNRPPQDSGGPNTDGGNRNSRPPGNRRPR